MNGLPSQVASRPRSLAANAPGVKRITMLLILVGLHVPLGILLSASPIIATTHAVIVLSVGLFLAGTSKRATLAVYIASYVVGCEVLWRMTKAAVPHEVGKYAVVAILGILGLRMSAKKGSLLPIVYFALLLPSTALTFFDQDLNRARMMVSFNLSGPLCLAVAAWFFSRDRHWPHDEVVGALIGILSGAVAVLSIATLGVLSRSNLSWNLTSNSAASGGFGPNQVAAVLGLGMMVCAVLWLERTELKWRIAMSMLAVAMAAQSALTFSRGGLYTAGGALLLGAIFLVSNRRARLAVVALGVVLAIIATLVLPRLDAFTGGALVDRFQDTDSTGRLDIARDDLTIWSDNILLGVGPGQSASFRARVAGAAAHTEFTRLPAEHGMLGVLSGLLLLLMGFGAFRRAADERTRGIVIMFCGWSYAMMLHSAMRLAAVGFLFGFAMIFALRPQRGNRGPR